MKSIVLSAIVASVLLLPPGLAVAQDKDQVVEAKGLISCDAARPGETFKAALVLDVQPGYHINDNAPLDEFLIPTVLSFDANPDFEIVEIFYPRGRRARFSYSEAELVVYEGQVALGALVKVKAGIAAGARSLKGSLSYQACNTESCLPPKELPFEIAVPVAAGGACSPVHSEIFDAIRFKSLRK